MIGRRTTYDAGFKLEIAKMVIVCLIDETVEVDGAVCYKGKNNGDGHFEDIAPESNGKALLHILLKVTTQNHLKLATHNYLKTASYSNLKLPPVMLHYGWYQVTPVPGIIRHE